MLPEGVLSIAIRADFWQPQKNERKVEFIKHWHQHAVLNRMNRYQKSCTQPCHGHFRAMPKGQKIFVLPRLLHHTFISTQFLRIYCREPFWPTDVPFGGHKTKPIRLGQISAAKWTWLQSPGPKITPKGYWQSAVSR